MASTPSGSSRARSCSNGRGYFLKSSWGPNCFGLTKMLTTTRWLSRRARLTRLSWPAWSAPMVGTAPVSAPACRHAIACSCMAIADSMTTGLAGGVLVLRGREGALAHVLVECARGGLDRLTEFGVLADKFRDVVGVQPEDILDDEHLGVTMRSGADADRRRRQPFRYPLTEHTRDALEDDGEGAGFLQRLGVLEDLLRRLITATLDAHATELVDELRRQPQVAHDRDAHRRQCFRGADHAPSSLHLHRMNTRLLQETAGVANRVLFGRVVGHEGHVADDQRVWRAANHCSGVTDHVVHRHAERVRISQHRVAQAVADQQDRDAGAVEPARGRVVVGGEHRELLAFGLPLAQVAHVGRHAAASLVC